MVYFRVNNGYYRVNSGYMNLHSRPVHREAMVGQGLQKVGITLPKVGYGVAPPPPQLVRSTAVVPKQLKKKVDNIRFVM